MLLKTWHFFGVKSGLILSGYFYEAKCGNLLVRRELCSNIIQKVAVLQVKIISAPPQRSRKRQNEALNFFVYFFVSRQKSEWVWARPSKKIQ
jgi:hypothetical protein